MSFLNDHTNCLPTLIMKIDNLTSKFLHLKLTFSRTVHEQNNQQQTTQ